MVENKAKVIVVGGGIIGCSTAYHLVKMGCKDVVLLEKGELTSGSTWHAAGLVGQLRSSRNVTQMLKYSAELYQRLEAETEQPTGFKAVGGLRVAGTEQRMQELRRSATMAQTFGLSMDMHTPQEAAELFPGMSTEGVLGAANLPTDGFIDPSSVTMALAKGARDGGAVFHRNIRVLDVKPKQNGGFDLETSQGQWSCDIFVNCAGMWARELGAMCGVQVPLQPMQHQYLVANLKEEVDENTPTMRDPDSLVYYKATRGEMVMGGYEHDPIPWATEGVPEHFGQQLLPPNFDHFEPTLNLALHRTPVMEEAEIVKLINGPEAFTPDGNPVMGEAPEVRNYFVAAGFNAFGIAAGGGAGKMMAEWILNGRPSLDLWELDILRFGPAHQSAQYLKDRTSEAYARHYSIAWPHEEFESGRPMRTSPLYSALKERGAVFGAKFGWERPNWFAPKGVAAQDTPSFGRPNWFPYVGEEHKAIRERAALIDQSSFSKFEIQGAGALAFLQRITDNQMDKPPGSITYTQMLTEQGSIACDLTVTRLGESFFYLTTGTAFATHDLYWMNKHLPNDGSVFITEVTSGRSCINLCGPRARDILASLTSDDVSNEGFPFLTGREIHIGYAPVRALRVTYVGELGWELHVPSEFAQYLYPLLREAGEAHGLVDAGYRAIESLRLEKGYRYWSGDITPDYTPYEAGLGFCVKLDKGDFIGREALLKHKAEGLKRKLCTITVADERAMAVGKEAILAGDEVLAVATSGGYGYTVGKTILLAYLPIDKASPGTPVTVEIMKERFEGLVEKTVLHDPKNEKTKA